MNTPAIYQYDEVLQYYRSDTRKREPQFLGFDIQDDNIEIDMEIAVPFLSVPTEKSVRRKHFANINVAAVILAGIVALGGTLLGGTARFLRGENFFNSTPFFRTGNKKKKQKRDIHEITQIGHEDYFWNILNNIDEALLEIDFDAIECAQRFLCMHVKNGLQNVKENRAQNIEKLFIELINSKWMTNVITNTKWNEAVRAAHTPEDCSITFSKCIPDNLQHFAVKIQKFAKPKN